MNGVWHLYRLSVLSGCGLCRKYIGSVHAPDDVMGDVLFDWMTDNMTINWNDYETDGDNEYVAVMPKYEGFPEYGWEFEPYADTDLRTGEAVGAGASA